MASILLSGPAGSGKSQEARRLLASAYRADGNGRLSRNFVCWPAWVCERDPETGRYPPRRPQDAYALPMTEYLRQAAISGALAQELDIVLTNERRRCRETQLPAGTPWARRYRAGNRSWDFELVTERLSVDGMLDPDQCRDAISRWYGRLS